MSNITRKMQRLLIASVVLVLPGMTGLLLSVGAVQAKAAELPVLESDSASPSSGCIFLGIEGKYIAGASDVLNRINAIRYEACTSGDVQDPRNPSRYLSKEDYVPIKWSKALEGISRIRAAEASLTLKHERLNGKNIWSVSKDGISAGGEVLAWNFSGNALHGVNQWYEEKDDWVNQDKNAVTGHYTAMIDPSNTYVGVASFYSENAARYPNTTAGSFSKTAQKLDQSMMSPSGTILQKLDVKTEKIEGLTMEPVYIGETVMPAFALHVNDGTLVPVNAPSLISKNNAVLSVRTDGKLTGGAKGTADLEITIGIYSTVLHVSVDCRHQYTLSEPDENNLVSGRCTKCGDEFTASVPGKFTIYWKNSTSVSNMYSSGVPSSNPVGSTLEAWVFDIDGSEDFQDLVIESSDERIVKVGDLSTKFKKLPVTGSGRATVTIYPKYNPKLKKTYIVNTGGESSNGIVMLVFNGSSNDEPVSKVQQKPVKEKGIAKANNRIQICTASKTLKRKTLKRKTVRFKITAKDRFGAAKQFVLDKKASPKKSRKYIKVSSDGIVTVKKGTPKGTYRITVKASAKESKTYNASSAVKEIRIKVKK